MTNDDNRYHIKDSTYYWLDTWTLANIIQLGTIDFCRKYLNRTNDPCGRQYDQMTQAARSGLANIAEGNARHYTSRETEMKLTDVARASIEELAGDYMTWLMQLDQLPWSKSEPSHLAVSMTRIDHASFTSDVQHESAKHILQQKSKFDAWLNVDDSIVTANTLLILCNRLIMMLHRQLETMLSDFRQEGGFTETLTAERLAVRTEKHVVEGAPQCPICGKPMIKRVAKKGIHSGREFWSCSGYPQCNGTRDVTTPIK